LIYRLIKKGGNPSKGFELEPVPFQNMHLEKELEDLLASHLLDVLFEGNQLLPIFQERQRQEEADIYALNREGDLVIFELKRAAAGGDAVHQALRYCERAAHWDYAELQRKLARYQGRPEIDLREEHRQSFDLEHPLERAAFNRQQRLIVVGSAGNDDLIRNVDYWKSRGLSLDFIPYRIYEIGGERYFEFFSIPYDRHSNPAERKGVIFDTNRSYNEESIWYMVENNRVASFGTRKDAVAQLSKGDTVFLFHKGLGIVGAGLVRSEVKADSAKDALYRDLEWLTAKPSRAKLVGLSAGEIKEALGHGFFWARILKVPYLSPEEIVVLASALKLKLS
jgi:hypothetical protein